MDHEKHRLHGRVYDRSQACGRASQDVAVLQVRSEQPVRTKGAGLSRLRLRKVIEAEIPDQGIRPERFIQ